MHVKCTKNSTYALQSTKALINLSRLLTYFTTVHVGDGSWRGTIEIFILNSKYQIQLYGNLVQISYHFYGIQKHTILENVVDPITSLQSVKNKAEKSKTQISTALNYEQYYELHISAATTLDEKFKRETKFGCKYRRIVYEIEQFTNDRDETSFGIDTSVGIIQEYASQKQSRFSIMSKEWRYSLSQQEKVIWDKLSESAKATILGN